MKFSDLQKCTPGKWIVHDNKIISEILRMNPSEKYPHFIIAECGEGQGGATLPDIEKQINMKFLARSKDAVDLLWNIRFELEKYSVDTWNNMIKQIDDLLDSLENERE